MKFKLKSWFHRVFLIILLVSIDGSGTFASNNNKLSNVNYSTPIDSSDKWAGSVNNSGNPTPQVRIELQTEESKITLGYPISGDWQFSVNEFEIDFDVYILSSARRLSKDKMLLILKDGTQLEVATKTGGFVTGEGEWGQTRVPWNTINSVDINIVRQPDKQTNTSQDHEESDVWQIVAESGGSVNLIDIDTAYGKGVGDFLIDGLYLTADPDQLQALEKQETGQYRLFSVSSQEIVGRLDDDDAKLSGKSKYGKISIPLSKIKKIIRIRPKITSNETPEPDTRSTPAQIRLKSGRVLEVSSIGGEWHFFTHNEFEFEINKQAISLIKIIEEPNFVEIDGLPGRLRSRWKENLSLSGHTAWGEIKVPWSNIAEFSRKIDMPKTLKSEDPIKIIAKSGACVNANQVDFSSVFFNGMSVTKPVWSAIKSIKTLDEGIHITGPNDFIMILTEGELTGKTQLGYFSIPLTSVKSINHSARKEIGVVKHTKPEYTLCFVNGNCTTASNIDTDSKIEVHDSDFDGAIEFNRKGLQYWLPKETLSNQGFKCEGGRLVLTVDDMCMSFDKPDWKIKLSTPIALIEGNPCTLRELSPYQKQAEKSISTAKGTEKVILSFKDNSKETFWAQDIQFVNYPKTGWTGSYWPSEWPFQWWPNDEIEVVKDIEGERIKIRADKLCSIQVIDNYSSRKLFFESLQGGKLSATHFYEVLNEERKHGPYKWQQDKEGILLKISSDVAIMVPFVAVSKIEFVKTLQAVSP